MNDHKKLGRALITLAEAGFDLEVKLTATAPTRLPHLTILLDEAAVQANRTGSPLYLALARASNAFVDAIDGGGVMIKGPAEPVDQ